MNPIRYSLLADENIHPAVIQGLRSWGLDVQTVGELGLSGQSDLSILRSASLLQRVVLTHDSDFGRLVFRDHLTFPGIIYLRPGHIDPIFTLETLDYLRRQPIDVKTPFVVVAERGRQTIRLRVREI